MKKFRLFLASRQFLGLLALVVAALVIWFVGPFISFGGLKPLAGAGMRVLLISLLLVGVLLWLADRSTRIVFVALSCLLIWYASPLLSFGQTSPFEPASVRLVAIAVVVSVFVVYRLFRFWQRAQEDEAFLQKMLHFGRKKAQSPAARRLQKVDAIVTSAMVRLKSMRTGARGPGKLFQGKRYLYELPWYITLGSGGTGKTSALLNGGLSFPIAEQMQRSAAASAGDANAVDWWFTNEAVLIDTTGYYTRHGTSLATELDAPLDLPDPRAVKDGDGTKTAGEGKASTVQAAAGAASNGNVFQFRTDTREWRESLDSAEWLGFLGMLRRHRPRAPINGALLTIELTALASADEQARIAEAAALRARLAELRQELGISFPVYLLVTKMDRLPGFPEYFGALTAESRAQAWGFTLPQSNGAIAKEGLRARCRDELTQLAGQLSSAVHTRLQDEDEARKNRRLILLPKEFSALIEPLVDLIERVFLDSRYDSTQLHSSLRGVYFTSAQQAGNAVVAERDTIVQRLAPKQWQGGSGT